MKKDSALSNTSKRGAPDLTLAGQSSSFNGKSPNITIKRRDSLRRSVTPNDEIFTPDVLKPPVGLKKEHSQTNA